MIKALDALKALHRRQATIEVELRTMSKQLKAQLKALETLVLDVIR